MISKYSDGAEMLRNHFHNRVQFQVLTELPCWKRKALRKVVDLKLHTEAYLQLDLAAALHVRKVASKSQ